MKKSDKMVSNTQVDEEYSAIDVLHDELLIDFANTVAEDPLVFAAKNAKFAKQVHIRIYAYIYIHTYICIYIYMLAICMP